MQFLRFLFVFLHINILVYIYKLYRGYKDVILYSNCIIISQSKPHFWQKKTNEKPAGDKHAGLQILTWNELPDSLV